MRTVLLSLLFVISFSAFSQRALDEDLATKLVAGSPWRFTTPYENSTYEFRKTADGKLQRMSSSSPGVWVDLEVTDKSVYFRTVNGHTVTFTLDRNGRELPSVFRLPRVRSHAANFRSC
jgi:hypothetical protein